MRISYLTLLFNFCINGFAQPQWSYPIYFEDATGACDTFWFVLDPSGTDYTDVHLNEGPVSMDTTQFNVYTLNYNGQKTKTFAKSILPVEHHNFGIDAMNLHYPLIMKWNKSLLYSSALPFTFDTASFWNTSQGSTWINMRDADSIIFYESPWGQFPIFFWFIPTVQTSVETNDFIENHIFPNPATDQLFISTSYIVQEFKIFNSSGVAVYLRSLSEERLLKYEMIKINDFPKGIYILEVRTPSNYLYYEKIIKF